MRALKGTLTFIIGMVMGVILFIAAIAGTLYAVATSIKIGQLQDKIGVQIFDDGSDVEDKTLWDVGKDLIGDVKGGITNLSLNQLAEKYGLGTKLDALNGFVGAIDFSPIFDVPIKDIGNSLHLIIDNVTLDDVGELAGMDFNSYNLPVLKDNLYVGVTKAIDSILKSIDAENITLRQIETNFGLSLGENQIFTLIKDSPLSSFGDLIDGMEIGALLDTDCDKFVKNGRNSLFVKVDRYEEVAAADYAGVKVGATTYVSGADENGNLVYKELRFKVKTAVNAEGVEAAVTDESGNTVYVVDNQSNKADFTADADNPVKFYRYVEYEAFSTEATYAEGTVYYVPTYVNHFVSNGTGYEPKQDGYIALTDIFTDATLSTSLNTAISGAFVQILPTAFFKSQDETPVAVAVVGYGIDPEKFTSADSRLEKGFGEEMLLIHDGTADSAIQAIAHISVSGLNNAADSLMGVKLSDLITIDENSAQILQAIKNKSLNELSGSIDDLVLSDVVEIDGSLYVEDANGIYVFVPSSVSYREYVAATDAAKPRYALSYVADENGKYVKIGGAYYVYDADDATANAQRDDNLLYNKSYTVAADGNYVVDAERGYYTLYVPSEHSGQTRYNKVTDKNDTNPDYFAATEAQLNDASVQKYYWNTTTKTMQTDVIPAATAYVKGTASSIVLQRLAEISIGDFSTAFSSLILGDVLDIDVDTYAQVNGDYITANPFVDYYYFDNGLYKLADSAYRAANPTATIYAVDVKGAGNAILKKLALIKIDEISAKMDDIVDSLFLADVVDVINDAYVPDANGSYVYVQDGRYYTLYNAAVHDATAARFSKYADGTSTAYVIASDAQISAGTELYYYDTATKTMTAYTTGDHGTLYVRGEASAKVLQRLARTPIAGFDSTFKTLYIGDVMDVNVDIYSKVADDYTALTPVEGTDYYFYDNGIYLTAAIDDATWQAAHADADIYVVSAKGEGNAVIKRMAFIPIEDIGNRMDAVIDDMALGDVVDVSSDFFYQDDNGKFVYVAAGKYYTLYNPAQHSPTAQRYSKYTAQDGTDTFSFIEATAEQITAGTGLYYWDGDLKQMTAYTSGDHGTLYVKGTASSMTLQRFVNVKIGKFSDEFSNLILSDVIAIDGDIYAAVSDQYIADNPDTVYYYYDNGIFRIADSAYRGTNPTADYYRIDTIGDSHVVIKKMAYLPVDALGTRMTDIINDLYLSDLIEIYEYDEVKPFTGDDTDAAARWIIAPNDDYTVERDGKIYEYTFVYDESGKYYLKDEQFVELTAEQLAKFDATADVTYGFTKVYTAQTGLMSEEQQLAVGMPTYIPGESWNDNYNKIAAAAALASHGGYGYYLDAQGAYHLNPALSAYLFSKGEYDRIYFRDTAATGNTADTWNNYTYDGEAMLQVEFMGNYVAYDAANPAHADLQKYLRLTEGYSMPAAGKTGSWYFSTDTLTFSESAAGNHIDLAFAKLNNVGTDVTPLYYFVKLDSEYNALVKDTIPTNDPITFSKQACTDIYVASATGEYAYFNGRYVPTSSLTAEQLDGITLLDKQIGYLANLNEASLTNGATGLRDNFLSTVKVEIVKSQSAPVLKAFARDSVKVSTLDQSIKEFTIGDMMNVTPDSMFDDATIKDAKIDELSIVLQNKLQSMTIGDILDWGNITTLSPTVMSIIRDAALEDFFAALEYNASMGTVTINIVKLYGYAE